MNIDTYMATIENRMRKSFDIHKNLKSRFIDAEIFAKFNISNQKYIASKKMVLYKYENNEYFFIKKMKKLDEASLNTYIDALKSVSDIIIKPTTEHMSSLICGVVVIEEDQDIDLELQNKILKFKYHKSFALGFKGWVDIALIVVYLNKLYVISNKKGSDAKKLFEIQI